MKTSTLTAAVAGCMPRHTTWRTGALAFTTLFFLTLPGSAHAQNAGMAQGGMTEEVAPPRLDWNPNDPRIGLAAGWRDAGEAISNLRKVATLTRADGFFNPEDPGDGRFSNTDIAFRGDLMFQGNYNGFQVYDISNPSMPRLRVSVVCPGGQGDLSVHGNLLVMSSQETRARLDCGVEGVEAPVSNERIRGIRIFDISNIESPRQVAAVQSCRGSHTHTILKAPNDDENLWVYIQGTSGVRPAEELAGCVGGDPEENPETALFRIEVVRVPLANPAAAEIVNAPRIFADAQGNIAGLNPGGQLAPGGQNSRSTNQCHDITMYPELGLAAGACSGNGILLDISDPANPVRINEVFDPNFAYWHSATFNNDGTAILFTDEWGGGAAPRCRGSDPATWGANAIFSLDANREMELQGYYKLPVPQSETENCVAHNGSLIPVPGRDIKVQAWYQGGVSVLDFTNPSHPFEIAYFDRGPLSDTQLFTGGYWSTYWYNGAIYGAEISRGIDVFELEPSEHLSAAEIAAAEAVILDSFNAQMQPRFVWEDTPVVARAWLDQLERKDGILASRAQAVDRVLVAAESGRADAAQLRAVAADLEADAIAVEAMELGGDAERLVKLAAVLRGIASGE
ncbi:MAG: hypothetical protein RQ745_07615 [Longimicrobiales bacterium]|nr:hypothetical protein [Longimicrobiales bacterium]